MAAASENAPQARRFWESGVRPAAVTDVGHAALDAVGLVPVVGDPADALNALWYAGDGDYASAGLSAAGLVPLVGEFVILQKFGRRILVRDGVVQGGQAGADILGRDTVRSLGDGASTFTTLAEAERYTYANLGAHQAQIDAFLPSQDRSLIIQLTFDHPVGRTMVKQLSDPVEATSVLTILRKDPAMPYGYRIATSFPEPG